MPGCLFFSLYYVPGRGGTGRCFFLKIEGDNMSASKCLLAALAAGAFFISISNAAIPAGYTGTTYPAGSAPREIPGRIDFKDYDIGGLNVTFYADDRAGQYGSSAAGRNDAGEHPAFYWTWHFDQDFFFSDSNNLNSGGVRYPSTDTSISDYYIGASHPTNWTKWTVHVAKAGTYWISSIWGGENGSFDFTISFLNGANTVKTSLIHCNGTGSYHKWRLFPDFASIQLDTGVQVLYFQNGSMHLNQDFLFFAAEKGQLPTQVRLAAASPKNVADFNISLNQKSVCFTLPDAGMTRVALYDCLGRKIIPLLDRALPAGQHTATLNTKELLEGVYFVRMEHNNTRAVAKVRYCR
jgi:hypothetical protein